MVVLNQHYRILFARDLLYESICKLIIDVVVVFPVGRTKDWTGMGNVAEGPQALIGETVVVPNLLFRTDPDPTECVTWIVGGNLQAVMTVDGFCVCIATSVRHPCTLAGA